MWGIMVLAMMVPTPMPIFKPGKGEALGLSVTVRFVFGYLVAWTGFYVAATALQYGFKTGAVLGMHNSSAAVWLNVTLLIGAGLFQLTNTKQIQLNACQLSLQRLKSSEGRIVISGVSYGTDCIKYCWPIMLTMFVFGLMNIYVMAALTAIMVAEKTVKRTDLFAKITGSLFIAAGLIALVF